MIKFLAIIIFFTSTCFFPVQTFSYNDMPNFEEYSVKDYYRGLTSLPRLRGNDKYYRIIIWWTSYLSPNFAGHYIVRVFGCGTECIRGFIMDAKTGYITWFPYYISSANSNYFDPISFKLGSSLIIFRGKPDEKFQNGEYYYNFKNGNFNLIKKNILPNDFIGKEIDDSEIWDEPKSIKYFNRSIIELDNLEISNFQIFNKGLY